VAQDRRPLTAEDREEISRCIALGLENKEIAAHIDRHDSVICREISRNGGRGAYRAIAAQKRAEVQRLRPKDRKLDVDPQLRERVHSDLRRGCSPDQIAGRLKYDHRCGHAVGMRNGSFLSRWLSRGFEGRGWLRRTSYPWRGAGPLPTSGRRERRAHRATLPARADSGQPLISFGSGGA
jgi:hypothetical protein